MESVFWWLILLVAGTGVSLRLLKLTRFNFRSRLEEFVFATGLGLGLWAYLVFVLGSFHLLDRKLFIFLALAMFTFSIRNLAGPRLSLPRRQAGGRQAPPPPARFLLFIVLFLVGIVFICIFAGAMAPPTGQDELCYHLQQPKIYVKAHVVYEVPYAISSLWPYLTEMLFTLGLLIQGAPLAKLFHLSFYFLTGAALYTWVREEEGSVPALWASAVYWLTPAVFIQAAFAYVDNALACFVLLAFYALFIFIQKKELRWAGLAGVFAGLAMSVKLIGLFVLPLAMTVFAWQYASAGGGGGAPQSARSPVSDGARTVGATADRTRRSIVYGNAIFLIASVLAGGIWYIRAWALRGNPVFPFYPQWFGGHGWVDTTYVNAHGRPGLFSFFLLPWDTVFHAQWFGGEKIGVLYLAFLPLVLFLKKSPLVRFAACAALGYTLLWFFVDQNIRFYFPALALWSVVTGSVLGQLSENHKSLWNKRVIALGACLFTLQAAFGVYHFKDEALLLLRRLNPDRYVSAREESYEAAKAANRVLKPLDHILSTGEIKGYYFKNLFTLEGDFSRFTTYGERFSEPSQVLDFLRGKGFTHVLTSSKEGAEETEGGRWRIRKILNDSDLRKRCFREDLIVKSRGVRYVLYEIL